MQFIDEAKIYIQSGHGGAGAVSFRREKFIPFGGPDGGDGGRGGSVIFTCTNDLNTLVDFRFQQHFKARRGGHGMGKDRAGAASPDLILRVPPGTQIFNEETGELIADFTQVGQTRVLAKGGKGGAGNARFKTSTNQAPRKHGLGDPHEEFTLRLKLKLLSDAGLLGLPNAGKSSFLAAVTRAKPKIGDYPFTTLTPQLGVVRSDDYEFVLADIPGLIEGAHEGHGLGDRFLGHIERCGVLLHLIDGTNEDVAADYHIVRHEVEAFSEGLIGKDEFIGLNKCDALTEEEIEEKRSALEEASGTRVFTLSAVTGEGIEEVLRAMRERVVLHRALLAETPPTEDATPTAASPAAALPKTTSAQFIEEEDEDGMAMEEEDEDWDEGEEPWGIVVTDAPTKRG